MKIWNILRNQRYFWILILAMSFTACGPVVITSRPGNPPPVWFYPNRLEVVRYVYFPSIRIYYDLSTHVYIYLENGRWVRNRALPPAYHRYNLQRERYIRVRDYRGDNIREYDQRRTTSPRTNRRN